MYNAEKDVVVAVASMQKDPVVSHVSELFSLGKMLTKSELTAGKVSSRCVTGRHYISHVTDYCARSCIESSRYRSHCMTCS